MRILYIIPSIDPKVGGPVEGIRRIGPALQDRGHQVEVLTLRDSPGKFSFPLSTHTLPKTKYSERLYGFNFHLLLWLKRNHHQYDAIIINGIWQFNTLGAWLALRNCRTPYFIFTHGMLDPWFKENYPFKHFKKWSYYPWAVYPALKRAKAVLFTSEEERARSKESFWLYSASERVVNYCAGEPPSVGEQIPSQNSILQTNILSGSRYIGYLSRIHEKKGVDILIRSFARLSIDYPELTLAIAGSGDQAYITELQALASSLGIDSKIRWLGLLTGVPKWDFLSKAEVFALPSHHENFGIAVVEALASGTPVVTTDKVNIWREIKEDSAGIICGDNEPEFTSALRSYFKSGGDLAIKSRRANARNCYASRFTPQMAAASIERIILEEAI